ncbi:MFS transporter [Mesorhizobium sp.]|uniref:MFS transporter n=1 Tax=Mesorhizobium sp. TaxID=1871066 RepID=UPI001205FE98|nr:MFS transporter [Mesorhizobium sp.]TIO77165.1 MAG: MFS transporter [Mesorhizobium sp.]
MSEACRIYCDQRPTVQSRVFLWFLASTMSAAVGRNGYYIASAWVLVDAGHGSTSVATMLAIVSLVELVASPLVGVVADRFDRRRLNIAGDLSRFAIMLATACALVYEDVFLTICLSAVLFAFCDRVALTSSQSVIPVVTRGGDLATSNSTVFFVIQSGCLGAALLFGPVLSAHSPALAFTVLAAFFFVSAISLFSVRLDSKSDSVNGAKSFALDIELRLARLFTVYALLYGGAVLVSVMGSSFVFEEHKGTAVDFGYVEATWSVGSLIGAVLAVRLIRTISAHRLHFVLLGATALSLTALPLMPLPWSLIIFAALGFVYNLGRVSVEVTLQSWVCDSALGRAKGVMHSFAVALGLLTFSAAALLGDSVFPSTVFFSFGVVLLISVPALSVGITRQKGEIMR